MTDEPLTATPSPRLHAEREPRLDRGANALRQTVVPRLLRQLLRPHWLIIVALTISVLAWAIPWNAGVERGYDLQEPLTGRAVVVLVLWYGSAVIVAIAGFQLGTRIAPFRRWEAFPSRRYYLYLSAFALFGVAYSYGKIFANDPGLIIDSIRTQTFNQVRYALDYSAGPQTLRYAAILSGGIALYRVFIRVTPSALDFLNFGLLVAGAALASRLSLIMAVLSALALFAYSSPRSKASLKGFVVLAGIVLLALVAFNYVRNAGYYRSAFGAHDPFTAAVYESVAYLGAPFQVSVGVARHSSIPGNASNLLVNGGAELGTRGWSAYNGGGGPDPQLFVTTSPRVVESGRQAVLVRALNTDDNRRPQFVFADPIGIQSPIITLGVSPGQELYLEAFVSGRASRAEPIRLGVRVIDGPDPGLITQSGIEAVRHDITKVNSRNRWRMEGVYKVPEGVRDLQLAVWQVARPHSRKTFAVDKAQMMLIHGPRDRRSLPKPSLAREIARYSLPTYFPADFNDILRREEHYRHFVDVQDNLTTNSVFGPMYLTLGRLAFPFTAIIAFFAAIIAGHASRYRSYFLLTLVVIGYCFAELWRTYMFNFGIIHFLLLALIGVPLLDGFVAWLRRQRAR